MNEWQKMKLTRAMKDNPEKSEVVVFEEITARDMDLQRQLGRDYQGDRYLRDKLHEAIDIAIIKDFLKDRPASSTQNLINGVAGRLSDLPRSAGAVYANWAITPHYDDDERAYYGLGQKYGGSSTRPVKSFVKITSGNLRKRDGRRGRPKWMNGIEGCFVCRKDHLSNQHHSRDDVTKAIIKLKARYQRGPLTKDGKAYIEELYPAERINRDDTADQQTNEEADLADDDSDGELEEDNDLSSFAESDLAQLEVDLAKTSFVQVFTVTTDRSTIPMVARARGLHDHAEFMGLKVDTGANKSSIMSLSQYRIYCKLFGVPMGLKPSTRQIKGIGEKREAAGKETIQIQFSLLSMIIDVEFLILEADVPTLLSMKDLGDNGLDISIQVCVIILGDLKQPLKMVNFFLVYRWHPDDLPFALYTESKLRTIHTTFGPHQLRRLRTYSDGLWAIN